MQKWTEKRKTQLLIGMFSVCVFAFLLIFFLGYYPLVVNNMDDWTYLKFRRPAVPLADEWNPAKVLPEILMPACAQIAVWLVMPLTGDYMLSMSMVFSTVLCLFIMLYITLFARLLMRLMNTDAPMAVLLSALFLIFHFRSWMSPWIPSQHLFYSEGLTTYFNYTVPALLNIILVLVLDAAKAGDAMRSQDHPIARGFLVLLLYLAIFSNLYSSVIIAVYSGVSLAIRFVKKLMDKTSLIGWIRACSLHIGILIAWFISMAFEFFGSRADSMASETPLFDRIKQTASILMLEIERMEDTVFWLCVLMIAAGLVLLMLSKGRKDEDKTYAFVMLRYLVCAGLTLVYLILLSAVVSPAYIARKDVLIGCVFFVFAAAFCSLAYIVSRWKNVAVAVPLVLFIMAFDVLIDIDTFAPSNALKLPQQTCLTIGQSFVQQVKEADEAGLSEVTLTVPKGMAELANWPYTYNMGGRMLGALGQHGMIEHIKAIHIEMDEHFFESFSAK